MSGHRHTTGPASELINDLQIARPGVTLGVFWVGPLPFDDTDEKTTPHGPVGILDATAPAAGQRAANI